MTTETCQLNHIIMMLYQIKSTEFNKCQLCIVIWQVYIIMRINNFNVIKVLTNYKINKKSVSKWSISVHIRSFVEIFSLVRYNAILKFRIPKIIKHLRANKCRTEFFECIDINIENNNGADATNEYTYILAISYTRRCCFLRQ